MAEKLTVDFLVAVSQLSLFKSNRMYWMDHYSIQSDLNSHLATSHGQVAIWNQRLASNFLECVFLSSKNDKNDKKVKLGNEHKILYMFAEVVKTNWGCVLIKIALNRVEISLIICLNVFLKLTN